ncbi:hypothetical protein [Xanthobacter autotrophicus]|uniref:hypothetical protein n=1 Tax=Xanthobacter autotrophicus TaxID=280 RepID=UPI0037295360
MRVGVMAGAGVMGSAGASHLMGEGCQMHAFNGLAFNKRVGAVSPRLGLAS